MVVSDVCGKLKSVYCGCMFELIIALLMDLFEINVSESNILYLVRSVRFLSISLATRCACNRVR